MKQVILVLYPGCIFNEVALVLELLAEKYEIIPISPDGRDHHASNGLIIQVKSAYSEVSLDKCVALLIPGGDPGSVKDNSEIDELIQNAHNQGIFLAAICAGPFLLAKAGVTKGKNIAHGYDAERLDILKDYFLGTMLTNSALELDGNILTAQPQACIDFGVEAAVRLGAVEEQSAQSTKDYYKGKL
jgi:4-methyl-5(b-hydroxyethyl)-thiazole monophosphate biosynthesis